MGGGGWGGVCSTNSSGQMEIGPRFKVSSEELEEPEV